MTIDYRAGTVIMLASTHNIYVTFSSPMTSNKYSVAITPLKSYCPTDSPYYFTPATLGPRGFYINFLSAVNDSSLHPLPRDVQLQWIAIMDK